MKLEWVKWRNLRSPLFAQISSIIYLILCLYFVRLEVHDGRLCPAGDCPKVNLVLELGVLIVAVLYVDGQDGRRAVPGQTDRIEPLHILLSKFQSWALPVFFHFFNNKK